MGTKVELSRQLGLLSAAALVVGEIVGIGIFLTPAKMANALASPLWLLLVWLVMGAMALCGALCYGELAARFPEAGGSYVYLREAFGRPMAFLFGWISMVVVDPGITALLAVSFAEFAVPILGLRENARVPIAIGTIIGLAAINSLGVGLGDRVLRGLTLLKLGLLGFIVAWGIGRGLGDWNNFVPFVDRHEGSTALIEALAGGLTMAFFCFAGWWDASKAAGEVRDPERNMPRALVLGVIVTTVVFVLVSAVFVYLVPLDRAKSGEEFQKLAGTALFGESGGKVFSAMICLVVAGSLCSILMMHPRVYFAMARDGLFLPALAHVTPRFGTPMRAIALQALLASAIAYFGGNFSDILMLFFFSVVLFVALSVAGLFILRRKPAPSIPLPPSGYPWTALFYIFCSAVLLFLIGAEAPLGAAIGIAAVSIGLLAYRFLPAEQRIG
jgi:APA family basic amino acid/polyamine antiporter